MKLSIDYNDERKMTCTYCYKSFKTNHTPIDLQTALSTDPYHRTCAKKQLYSFMIRQMEDEEQIDLSHYRTSTISIWPSLTTLRLCIYYSRWYRTQTYLLEECVRHVKRLIRRQIYH